MPTLNECDKLDIEYSRSLSYYSPGIYRLKFLFSIMYFVLSNIISFEIQNASQKYFNGNMLT